MELLNVKIHGRPKGATFIGRGSPLGNPFVIGIHGTREEVINKYEKYLEQKISDRDPDILHALEQLNDESRLLCFCTPERCHGEIIMRLFRRAKKMDYEPADDGINHINCYSKGKTKLGQLLSNFAHTPINHPEYGHFESIEGFWYWLKTGMKYEQFRRLYGYHAKKEGLKHQPVYRPDFQEQILKALKLKLEQHPQILEMLKACKLPLTHYYWFGEPPNAKIQHRPQDQWLMNFFEGYKELQS